MFLPEEFLVRRHVWSWYCRSSVEDDERDFRRLEGIRRVTKNLVPCLECPVVLLEVDRARQLVRVVTHDKTAASRGFKELGAKRE